MGAEDGMYTPYVSSPNSIFLPGGGDDDLLPGADAGPKVVSLGLNGGATRGNADSLTPTEERSVWPGWWYSGSMLVARLLPTGGDIELRNVYPKVPRRRGPLV